VSRVKIKPGLSDDWDPAWDLKLSDEEKQERDAEIAALEKANFGSGPAYDLDLHLARPIG
jgi:hypothetical protein